MLYKYYAAASGYGADGVNEDRVMVDGNLLQNGEINGRTSGRLLAAVCDGSSADGFSGEAAGISAVSMRCARTGKQYPFSLMREVYKANKLILSEQSERPECVGMKTAMAAIYIDEQGYLVLNVGDVGVFHFGDGGLQRLTKDACRQTSNPSAYRLGMKAARLHVSMAGDMSRTIREGLFLVCTEALFGSLPTETLEEALANPNKDTVAKGRALFELLKQRDLERDISFVLIEAGREE